MNNLYENFNFEDSGANAFLRGKANVYTEEIDRFNDESHYDCAIQLYKI